MFKFVKICFFGILIFACSCLGFKITHSDEIQASFFAPQITVSPPPSKYDLRNHIDIGVENQHTLGICYAFASLTSLETYLALNYNEYYDFSELHFATALHVNDDYYSSVNDALTQGGNFAFFSLYTQKQNSLVLENEMSMTDYMNWSGDKSSRLLTKFKNLTNNHYQIARVNDTITYPQYIGNKSQYSSGELTNFRNKIKNHIMNYGALAGTIHSSSGLTHSTINYKITDNSLIITPDKINKSLNHSISIVGWDDNYTANGEWADSPGAYICLNSWGTSFGDNGYFYVSYNDYFIESSLSGVTNATLSTSPFKFGSVDSHQQKTALYDHVFDEPYPTVYTANIFNTSKYIGQSITHIDSYIEGSATKFYIQFFNSHSSALSSINNINSYIGATKVDDYTLYTKYQLSSPLYINNNYMVVIREISQTKRTHSIGSRTINNIDISPTYYNGSKSFNLVENVWKPK
ncbi:MAG: C1 family peptidase, partial [Clostridia bacterium]